MGPLERHEGILGRDRIPGKNGIAAADLSSVDSGQMPLMKDMMSPSEDTNPWIFHLCPGTPWHGSCFAL
jgi:hypothetical protein